MALSEKQSKEIKQYLTQTIRRTLSKYTPETISKPFHYRLLGKDRYAMFSFIQSINTVFGMSIYEQIGVMIAQDRYQEAKRQYKVLGTLSQKMENAVAKIHSELRSGERDSDKDGEVRELRAVSETGPPKKDPDSTVDLYVLDKNGIEHYFDIVSAKPNMKEFVELKRKLLRWTCLRFSQNPNAKLVTQLAIPYNPYEPEPYDRWTLKGLYDLKSEILVGDEFWNFLGGKGTYQDLLDIFEEAGHELYDEIDTKMKEIGNS